MMPRARLVWGMTLFLITLSINVIANRVILLIIFDHNSSLGLVRLRVQQRVDTLVEIVEQVMSRTRKQAQEPVGASVQLGEITDDDIDALFG